MKIHAFRNPALAFVALLALSLYILACTSFSPDDSKVLYPAFSGTNGGIGLASYDRHSKRSEMLFVSAELDGVETNGITPEILRGQWLGEGGRILATWTGKNTDDVLHLAIFPFGGRGTIQFYTLPGKEMSRSIMIPPPVVGDSAFLMDGDNQVVRFHLADGTRTRHQLGAEGSEWVLYPAADGKTIFYIQDRKSAQERFFGRLDPNTFALTPIITFTNQPESGFSFAYDFSGERVAFMEKSDNGLRLVMIQAGKTPVLRELPGGGKALEFANAVFSRGGDALLAGFRRQREGASVSEFGLIEIPFQGGAVRETVLIPATDITDQQSACYFQIGISHDGKTAAAASTYLACLSESFKASDCALFFIDLSDSNRKVTKVPIPLPARRAATLK